MLQEIIQLHDEAVTALADKIAKKNVITFKSPTGSGKTYMMADFMDRILSERNDVVFLVSSLSKSDSEAYKTIRRSHLKACVISAISL